MNGKGDIGIKHTTFEEYKAWPQEQKEWLHYNVLQSLSCTCHARPAECAKRFVKKIHVVLALVFIIGVCIGLGVLQVQYVLPALIKNAIAAI